MYTLEWLASQGYGASLQWVEQQVEEEVYVTYVFDGIVEEVAKYGIQVKADEGILVVPLRAIKERELLYDILLDELFDKGIIPLELNNTYDRAKIGIGQLLRPVLFSYVGSVLKGFGCSGSRNLTGVYKIQASIPASSIIIFDQCKIIEDLQSIAP